MPTTPETAGTKAVSQLKSNPKVVDVIYSKDLIKSVNDNIRKISIILLIIAGLFTYISFALINNTVRLTIFSKRFLINTMKLVGGKSKDGKQIANMSNSYIAADGIELPYGNKIPLWLFGFLY